MAIVESAAVASIIGKLLSMSTDLIERKESREVLAEIREFQKLTIELHTLYTKIESKHHEIESNLQEKLSNSMSQNLQLEKAAFNAEKEKDEILKRQNDWEQYERKVSREGFVYFVHKSEPRVYACAACKGREPYPITLQPNTVNNSFFTCHKCKTVVQI